MRRRRCTNRTRPHARYLERSLGDFNRCSMRTYSMSKIDQRQWRACARAQLPVVIARERVDGDGGLLATPRLDKERTTGGQMGPGDGQPIIKTTSTARPKRCYRQRACRKHVNGPATNRYRRKEWALSRARRRGGPCRRQRRPRHSRHHPRPATKRVRSRGFDGHVARRTGRLVSRGEYHHARASPSRRLRFRSPSPRLTMADRRGAFVAATLQDSSYGFPRAQWPLAYRRTRHWSCTRWGGGRPPRERRCYTYVGDGTAALGAPMAVTTEPPMVSHRRQMTKWRPTSAERRASPHALARMRTRRALAS